MPTSWDGFLFMLECVTIVVVWAVVRNLFERLHNLLRVLCRIEDKIQHLIDIETAYYVAQLNEQKAKIKAEEAQRLKGQGDDLNGVLLEVSSL